MANTSDKKFKCLYQDCGRASNDPSEFYISASPLHAANNARMPICKKCLQNLYIKYLGLYNDKLEALNRVCMAYDIYFSPDVFATIDDETKPDAIIGTYIKRLNLGCSNKTYDDSINEDTISTIQDTKETENTETPNEPDKEKKKYQPTNKTVKFWGDEFIDEPESYRFLDDEYTSWVIRANNGESPSKALESTLKEMCKIQLDIKKSRKSNAKTSDITSLYTSYNKLAQSAGLNPNQEDSTNLAERNALGVLIDVWENTEPVPVYPEENKIIQYIKVWFKGHLAKAAGLKNDTENEYKEEIEKYKVKLLNGEPSSVQEDGDDIELQK